MSYRRKGRATAKQNLRRAVRVPPAINEDRWCPARVAIRMSAAMRTVRRCVSRVGPREYGNSMPEVEREPLLIADMIEQMQEPGLFHQTNEIAMTVYSAEISRMEEAIRWPGRYLVDQWPGPNNVLKIWLNAIGSGRSPKTALKDAGYGGERGRYALDTAFSIIADGLHRDGFPLDT